MTQQEIREKMEEIADVTDGKVYEGYSGRGMYGRRCWGVSGPDATAIIEEAAALGIRNARWDNLGLGSIVYWPHLKHVSETVETEG